MMEIGIPGIGLLQKNEPFRGTLPAGAGTLMGNSIFSIFQQDELSVALALRSSCGVAKKYLAIRTGAF